MEVGRSVFERSLAFLALYSNRVRYRAGSQFDNGFGHLRGNTIGLRKNGSGSEGNSARERGAPQSGTQRKSSHGFTPDFVKVGRMGRSNIEGEGPDDRFRPVI